MLSLTPIQNPCGMFKFVGPVPTEPNLHDIFKSHFKPTFGFAGNTGKDEDTFSE